MIEHLERQVESLEQDKLTGARSVRNSERTIEIWKLFLTAVFSYRVILARKGGICSGRALLSLTHDFVLEII